MTIKRSHMDPSVLQRYYTQKDDSLFFTCGAKLLLALSRLNHFTPVDIFAIELHQGVSVENC